MKKDPQYFYEMYENLEHKGLMVDNNQSLFNAKSQYISYQQINTDKNNDMAQLSLFLLV